MWFILQGDLFFALSYFVLVLFFSPFSIAITSLGEERANLSAFRTFVRSALVRFCLRVWEGLLPVLVALPGFFFYLSCEVLIFLYEHLVVPRL